MSDLFSKNKLTMKSKRGVIPKTVWNRLVDVIYAFRIKSVVGGRLEQSPLGTTLIIDGVPASAGGGGEIVAESCDALKAMISGASLTVSTGYVGNDIPEIGGVELNDPMTPSFALTGTTTLWLCVDFVPNVRTLSAGGSTVYLLDEGGSTENPEFVLSVSEPSEVLPEVDKDTGAVTNGKIVVRWADITQNGALYSLESGDRCGNLYFAWCSGVYHLYFEVAASGDDGGGGGASLPAALSWDDGFDSGTFVLISSSPPLYQDASFGITLVYSEGDEEWSEDWNGGTLVDPTGLAPQGDYGLGFIVS